MDPRLESSDLCPGVKLTLITVELKCPLSYETCDDAVPQTTNDEPHSDGNVCQNSVIPRQIRDDENAYKPTDPLTNKNRTDKEEHLQLVVTDSCRANTAVDSRYVFVLKNGQVAGINITGLLEVRTSGGTVTKRCRCKCTEVVGKLMDKLNSARGLAQTRRYKPVCHRDAESCETFTCFGQPPTDLKCTTEVRDENITGAALIPGAIHIGNHEPLQLSYDVSDKPQVDIGTDTDTYTDVVSGGPSVLPAVLDTARDPCSLCAKLTSVLGYKPGSVLSGRGRATRCDEEVSLQESAPNADHSGGQTGIPVTNPLCLVGQATVQHHEPSCSGCEGHIKAQNVLHQAVVHSVDETVKSGLHEPTRMGCLDEGTLVARPKSKDGEDLGHISHDSLECSCSCGRQALVPISGGEVIDTAATCTTRCCGPETDPVESPSEDHKVLSKHSSDYLKSQGTVQQNSPKYIRQCPMAMAL